MAGKRYKFHGSTFQFVTAFATSTTAAPDITGITQANPAVVTAAAHGLSDGDIVQISGVVGMTEINGETFVVENSDTNTFELADTNSINYGAYVSGGEVFEAVLSGFCELTSYNRQGGSAAEIQATSACSTAQEFEIGLPDYGTTSVDFNFAPQTGVQAAIKAFADSGEKTGFVVTLPNSGGTMVQLGFVQSTSENAGVGGLWTGSLTMRNTGARADFA